MTVAIGELGIHAVVLDIEGTTTPIAFVYQVLFPYARAELRATLRDRWNSSEVGAAREMLRAEHAAEPAGQGHPPPWNEQNSERLIESVASYCEWLMDLDRKSPGLKLLQGLVWEGGFRKGALTGEVFTDVPGALERWSAAGIEIAIYSSGSALAQRLIFGNTRYGDLTHYIAAFFDTSVGPKRSADSYRGIAAALQRGPPTVLFLSDVSEELEAAQGAGMQVALCVRPGNAPVSRPERFIPVGSFDEILA